MRENLSPQNIQKALDQMKSMLLKDRADANTHTQYLELRRGQSSSMDDSRLKKMEEDLTESRKLLEEQKQVSAELLEQLAAERGKARTQLTSIETRIQALQEESEAVQKQSRGQRALALDIIQGLELERDELRAELNEQNAKSMQMEEELAAFRKLLQERERGEDFGPLTEPGWKVSDRPFFDQMSLSPSC